MKPPVWTFVVVLSLVIGGCALDLAPENGASNAQGDQALVTHVVDGDTIEVRMNDVGYRVRYIGVNTPERDETCYAEAADANVALVENQTVTLVRDTSNTDQFGRLLRYVYIGDQFVNAILVTQGYAEAVEYPPDTAQT